MFEEKNNFISFSPCIRPEHRVLPSALESKEVSGFSAGKTHSRKYAEKIRWKFRDSILRYSRGYGIVIKSRRRIEVVITSSTRNLLRVWQYAPLKFPVTTEFLLGSKIKYLVVLSVSSCEKFFKRKRNYIHGELSEWSKVQHSKCCKPKGF